MTKTTSTERNEELKAAFVQAVDARTSIQVISASTLFEEGAQTVVQCGSIRVFLPIRPSALTLFKNAFVGGAVVQLNGGHLAFGLDLDATTRMPTTRVVTSTPTDDRDDLLATTTIAVAPEEELNLVLVAVICTLVFLVIVIAVIVAYCCRSTSNYTNKSRGKTGQVQPMPVALRPRSNSKENASKPADVRVESSARTSKPQPINSAHTSSPDKPQAETPSVEESVTSSTGTKTLPDNSSKTKRWQTPIVAERNGEARESLTKQQQKLRAVDVRKSIRLLAKQQVP